MKLFNNSPLAKARRKRVISRLETQLISKIKENPEKLEGNDINIPLTEADVKRINKELKTLKERI